MPSIAVSCVHLTARVPVPMHRRAYLKYRDRQRLQKEEDRRTIEELHSRLKQLECERSDLKRRVDLLQKVRTSAIELV